MDKSGIERTIRSSDKERIVSSGVERTFFSYIPQNLPSSDIPLVFILHGALANGENAMRMANMEEIAEHEGFILVYPDGAGKPGDALFTWNSGNCCGYARETQSKDSQFLSDLIEHFSKHFPVSLQKIYAAGFSNGAMMAHRFACECSNRVAAIAAIAGAKNFEGQPKEPVSVLVFHGTEDGYTPYNGGEGTATVFKRQDRSVKEGVEFWVKHNDCEAQPDITLNQHIRLEKYSQGRNQTEVWFYTIEKQGHAWPGGRPGIRYGNIDAPTTEIDASRTIWEFFKTHSKVR